MKKALYISIVIVAMMATSCDKVDNLKSRINVKHHIGDCKQVLVFNYKDSDVIYDYTEKCRIVEEGIKEYKEYEKNKKECDRYSKCTHIYGDSYSLYNWSKYMDIANEHLKKFGEYVDQNENTSPKKMTLKTVYIQYRSKDGNLHSRKYVLDDKMKVKGECSAMFKTESQYNKMLKIN